MSIPTKLTGELITNTYRSLPEITGRVEYRLQQVEKQLSEFPELAKAPCFAVMTEVERVRATIVQQLTGESLNNEFRESYRKILRDLRLQFKDARPRLHMKTPGFEQPSMYVDSGDETPTSTLAPTPSKSRKGNDGHAVTTPNRVHAIVKKNQDTASGQVKMVFQLDQIRHQYESGSTSGLPDQLNPKVTDHLILQCLRGWRNLVHNSLGAVRDLVATMLSESIENTLGTRQDTLLLKDVGQAIQDLFLELMDHQQDKIETLVTYETHKPITYASNALKQGLEATERDLESQRIEVRVNEHFDTIESNGFKVPKMEERKKKAGDPNWVQQTLGSDPYAREVKAMATPFAYYDIASARLLDTIAMHLEYELMYTIENNLRARLMDRLQATDSEHCAQLLAENPRREDQRRRLVSEKAKLLQALQELQGLPQLNTY